MTLGSSEDLVVPTREIEGENHHLVLQSQVEYVVNGVRTLVDTEILRVKQQQQQQLSFVKF